MSDMFAKNLMELSNQVGAPNRSQIVDFAINNLNFSDHRERRVFCQNFIGTTQRPIAHVKLLLDGELMRESMSNQIDHLDPARPRLRFTGG